MAEHSHEDEYDDALVDMLELIWGKGFISPGGPRAICDIVEGIDLADKLVLDIGCGIGGVDVKLVRDHGCDIIALEIEAPLLERARARAAAAGRCRAYRLSPRRARSACPRRRLRRYRLQ